MTYYLHNIISYFQDKLKARIEAAGNPDSEATSIKLGDKIEIVYPQSSPIYSEDDVDQLAKKFELKPDQVSALKESSKC